MSSESPLKKCLRNGCNKQFNPTENKDDSCCYHKGKPIFHDTKKGWTCCNKTVYDWDEFQAMQGCCVGPHSDVQDEDSQGFFKSSTVANAQKAIEKEEVKAKIMSIADYNKQEEKKLEENQKKEASRELFVTPSGNYKCTNKACNKEFPKDDLDKEGICLHHPGEPVFHDLKKSWSCCKVETWDWDEFMKIPLCAKGKHAPKYK